MGEDDLIYEAEQVLAYSEFEQEFESLTARQKGAIGLLTAAHKLGKHHGDHDMEMTLMACRLVGLTTEEMLEANRYIGKIAEHKKRR